MYKRPALTPTLNQQTDLISVNGICVRNPQSLLYHTEKPSTYALDQYYTKPDVVDFCLNKLGKLSEFDLVIEPSAGDGAFYSKIKHPNLIGLDIHPRHAEIKKMDWLGYVMDKQYTNVAVVGNPPFGRFNSLSTAFIKRALMFPAVSRIAFILPDVYNKHTRQAIIPNHWRIKSVHKLPRESFLYEGESRHVPCSFFVFCQSSGADLRAPTMLPNVTDFEFSNHSDYDVFVFGGAPKRILQRGEVKKNNRGHFLKANIPVDELIANLKSINWKGNSCASGGVYWLTKIELATQYCHKIKRKAQQ